MRIVTRVNRGMINWGWLHIEHVRVGRRCSLGHILEALVRFSARLKMGRRLVIINRRVYWWHLYTYLRGWVVVNRRWHHWRNVERSWHTRRIVLWDGLCYLLGNWVLQSYNFIQSYLDSFSCAVVIQSNCRLMRRDVIEVPLLS
jgi:hypothetical protein